MAEGRKGLSGMKGRVSARLRRDDEAREQVEGLRKRVVTLEREVQENRELKRANEILKRAASFFGAELDRQHKK